MTETDLQKIDVKFAAESPAEFNSDAVLAVFGRWRLEEGEQIIDLADYGHVPDGPGCLLVGHLWHFGINWSGGQPGVYLSNRRDLSGEVRDRLRQALRLCAEKGKRLLSESEIPDSVKVNWGDVAITVNDRVQYPNTAESDVAMRPAVTEVADALYGSGAYTIERDEDPASRLSYRVQATSAPDVDGLLSKLR